MVENAPRWPMVGGTDFEVISCLGAALVDLLCGGMGLTLRMVLETGMTSVRVNVKDWGGGGTGALREPIDSNRSFPVMSTLSIILVALQIVWYMLDFRSSVSCYGFR